MDDRLIASILFRICPKRHLRSLSLSMIFYCMTHLYTTHKTQPMSHIATHICGKLMDRFYTAPWWPKGASLFVRIQLDVNLGLLKS